MSELPSEDPEASGPPELAALRTELSELDRSLIERAARRRELAARIGALKRERDLATRDFRQEREVIERARRAAVDLDAPPEMAEELIALLIRSSLTVQERERVSAAGGGTGKTALVIGGHGGMGGWFARFLASQGYGVGVADPAPRPPGSDAFPHVSDWTTLDLAHDVIVVAAPLRVSAHILEELAERRPPGLVFDVGSLKGPLRPALRALADAGVRVTSIHPMFGPDTELLSGKHVIFADVGVPAATDQARALFASTMAVTVNMSLDGHDRAIAWVLGLSHALNIAFFTALSESGESVPDLERLSSTTFDAQLEVAARVAAENPHLYFEIQHLNRYGLESLDALADAVERVRALVAEGKEEEFVSLMRRGRRLVDDPASADAP